MCAITLPPLPGQPGASAPRGNTGRLKRLFLCWLWLLSTAALPVHAEIDIPPGIYFTMRVGFNPDTRQFTGHYENHTGWDEDTQSSRFSCIFYLYGKIEGEPPYPISTWYPSDAPEIIPGVLNVSESDGNFFLNLRLNEEHGGCWNVENFTDEEVEEGREFRLEEEMPWREIRVIAVEKALLHDTPAPDSVTSQGVTAGTSIGVLDSRPGWVFMEEYYDEHLIKGWIRSEDLFPVQPARPPDNK